MGPGNQIADLSLMHVGCLLAFFVGSTNCCLFANGAPLQELATLVWAMANLAEEGDGKAGLTRMAPAFFSASLPALQYFNAQVFAPFAQSTFASVAKESLAGIQLFARSTSALSWEVTPRVDCVLDHATGVHVYSYALKRKSMRCPHKSVF
eukprot:1142261-Pelagomonas_calceolata.AAC.10